MSPLDDVCLLLGADTSTFHSREQDDEVAESVRILKPPVLQRDGMTESGRCRRRERRLRGGIVGSLNSVFFWSEGCLRVLLAEKRRLREN